MVYETTIKVSRTLRNKLKEEKQPHETYNDYIIRLYQTKSQGGRFEVD